MDTEGTEKFAQFANEFLLTTEEEPSNLTGGGLFDWLFERPNAVIFFKKSTFEKIQNAGITFPISKRINTILYEASTAEGRQQLIKENKDVPIDKFIFYKYFLDGNAYHMRLGEYTADLIKTEKLVISSNPGKDRTLSSLTLVNYKGLSTVGKLNFLSNAIVDLTMNPSNQDLRKLDPSIHNELANARKIIDAISDKITQHGGNNTVLDGGYIQTVSFGQRNLKSDHLDKKWMDYFLNVVNGTNNIKSIDSPDAFNSVFVIKEDADTIKLLDLILYP